MINFPTQIPDYDPDSLDSISSDTTPYSTMVFLPLWNPDDVVVSVSIDIPSN